MFDEMSDRDRGGEVVRNKAETVSKKWMGVGCVIGRAGNVCFAVFLRWREVPSVHHTRSSIGRKQWH